MKSKGIEKYGTVQGWDFVHEVFIENLLPRNNSITQFSENEKEKGVPSISSVTKVTKQGFSRRSLEVYI